MKTITATEKKKVRKNAIFFMKTGAFEDVETCVSVALSTIAMRDIDGDWYRKLVDEVAKHKQN